MAKTKKKLRKVSASEKAKIKKILSKKKHLLKETYPKGKKKAKRTGGSLYIMDQIMQAKPPGRRVSQNGKVYYEYRENRADVSNEKI